MSSGMTGSALMAFQTIHPSAMIGIFRTNIIHTNAHPKVCGWYPGLGAAKSPFG
jgi:hypothetical protein